LEMMNTPQLEEMRIIPLTDLWILEESSMEDIGYERKILAGLRFTRRFSGEKVSYNDLISIVEMARWAPSIGNIQPWEMIIVDDPLEILKLSRLHPYGRVFDKAGALIFVVTDPEQSPHHIVDGGCLLAYLALASSIKGYSILLINLNNDPVIRDELNIPPTKYLLGLIAVGKEEPGYGSIPPRKPVETIVHRNKYGLKR